MDKIIIKDLIVHAQIGVYDNEKKTKQPLSIDLIFRVDASHAAKTDRLADTVNYDLIYESIFSFISQTPCELIETLAERLAEHLKQTFQLSWLQLSITKKPFSMPYVSGVKLVIER